jgi:hypothetical protein
MTRVDLVRKIREAALSEGLRSGIDKALVRKWEVNGVTPNATSQRYIAAALGLPAAAAEWRNWPRWLPDGSGDVVPLGPTSTVPALREALRATMDRTRRKLLTAVSATALLSLASSWATADAAPQSQTVASGPVDDELLSMLEDHSARLTCLATEQRQHTAPLLDAHLSTVTNLLAERQYTPAHARRLHALAAGLSQTVAWHRFDLGLYTEATRYWVGGLHSAHAVADHDMGAALLSDLAYQASWRRDPATAAGILERALTRAVHPAAQSLLQLRLARALAAQGERRPTMRALAAAEHLLGKASESPTPAWCSWMSDADLAVDSGQCLIDLGDTRRAHTLIREGQNLLPTSRDKTRGVFLAYQASSHLELREPELAAATALESLTLARRIGAPRCINLVQDLIPRFKPFRAAQGVPELLAKAAA